MHFSNQKGITLLEILISISILIIVIVSIMTIFPQMGLMNQHNQNKQQAINFTKKELLEWQAELEKIDNFTGFLANPTGTPIKNKTVKNIFIENNNLIILSESSSNNRSFDVKVTLHRENDLKKDNNDKYKDVAHTNAYKIMIQLFENDLKISETYGYVFPEG